MYMESAGRVMLYGIIVVFYPSILTLSVSFALSLKNKSARNASAETEEMNSFDTSRDMSLSEISRLSGCCPD